MKRVTPEALINWYQDIGCWTVSENKLPSFKKHVAYAQSLGLRYLLWTSPFFLGARSPELQAVKAIPEAISREEGVSHSIIDPAYTPLAESTQAKLIRLVSDLGLDGLKVDFLDYIP